MVVLWPGKAYYQSAESLDSMPITQPWGALCGNLDQSLSLS